MIRKLSFVVVLFAVLCGSVFAQRSDKLGKYVYVSDSFTRADDQAPYDIGDLFSCETSRFLRFANVVKVKGTSADITGIEICLDTMAGPTLSLTLFDDTTGITLPLDNEPLRLTYDDLSHVIGRIDGFTLDQTDSSDASYTSYVYATPFICTWVSKNLYGLLSIGAAYTPKALGNVRVGLWIRRN